MSTELNVELNRVDDNGNEYVMYPATKAEIVYFRDGQSLQDKSYMELTASEYAELEKMLS